MISVQLWIIIWIRYIYLFIKTESLLFLVIFKLIVSIFLVGSLWLVLDLAIPKYPYDVLPKILECGFVKTNQMFSRFLDFHSLLFSLLQQQASRKSNVPIQFIWRFSFAKFATQIMYPAKEGA